MITYCRAGPAALFDGFHLPHSLARSPPLLPPSSELRPRLSQGTPVEAIMATEDREIFSQKLKEINEKVAKVTLRLERSSAPSLATLACTAPATSAA